MNPLSPSCLGVLLKICIDLGLDRDKKGEPGESAETLVEKLVDPSHESD